jgi:hypothetical protein
VTGGAERGYRHAPSQTGRWKGGDLQVAVVDLIELLLVSALSPLHAPVELWTSRWEGEEPDASLLAGPFKVCLELTASVHLNGPQGGGWESSSTFASKAS